MVMDTQKRARDNSYLLSIIAFIGMVWVLPNGMNLREQRMISFELLAFFLLAVMIFRIHKPLGVFVGYLAVSAPFHHAIDVNVLLAFLSFGLLYILSTNVEKPEILYDVVCVSAILCVIWQTLQLFGLWVFMSPVLNKAYVGLLSNTNETSAFLAISLPCFFRGKWAWFIPIILVGLFIGKSVGGIVAASIAGLVWLFQFRQEIGWKKCSVVILVGMIIFSAYLWNRDFSVESHKNGRWKYWTDMAPVANMKLFGWGLGQFKFVMPLLQAPTLLKPEYRMLLYKNIGDKKAFEQAVDLVGVDKALNHKWTEIWLEAHNEYMEVWFMAGLFGLLMLLYAIYDTLMMPSALIPKYGFLIACISACWFFSFQIAPIAIITILYMGGIHAKNNC